MMQIRRDNPDLNGAEQNIAVSNSALVRLPSQAKPCALQVPIIHHHNPDFMLFNFHIEVKGRIWRHEWIRMMANLKRPDRYKVILTANDRNSRRKLIKSMTRLCPQVEYAHIEDTTEPWKDKWLKLAKLDWETCMEEDREATRKLVKRMTGDIPLWLTTQQDS